MAIKSATANNEVFLQGTFLGIGINADGTLGTTKGARWKVPGSPNGRGSLTYLGDDAAPYKKIYEIKSKDDAKSWADLAKFCKVLNCFGGYCLMRD